METTRRLSQGGDVSGSDLLVARDAEESLALLDLPDLTLPVFGSRNASNNLSMTCNALGSRDSAPSPPGQPPVPVVPPFRNSPSWFLYCPEPLADTKSLGGLSPCLLLTVLPVVLLSLVLATAFGNYFVRKLLNLFGREDPRGEYRLLASQPKEQATKGLLPAHRVQLTTTDTDGQSTETIVDVDPSTSTLSFDPPATLRYPNPPSPIPLLLAIVQYFLVTVLAVSCFELLYLLQHVLVPDSTNPGPILRWTLTPSWTGLPWGLSALAWLLVYAIWVTDFEEDVELADGSRARMVVPKYVFRWRYHGLHLVAFMLMLVELYHRVAWVKRMDGIHGVFGGAWRAERWNEIFGGLAVASAKLGLPLLKDTNAWTTLLAASNGTSGGLEGMGGWTAVAGEDWSFLICFGTRFFLLALSLPLSFSAVWLGRNLRPGDPDAVSEEEEDLLLDDAGAKALKEVRAMLAKAPQTWGEYWFRFRKVLRFAWPEKMTGRIALICCFVLLVLGRVVNVNVPLLYKKVVDELSQPSSQTLPIRPLVQFATLKILQGGLLDAISSVCWVPVAQHINKDVSVSLFEHLMELSIRWHMVRKTGETIKVQNRGVTSVVDILNAVMLQVLPVLMDLFLACAFFATQFDSTFALIVFTTMIVYSFASYKLTNLRTRHRKAANQLDNKVSGKAVDALVNFESVKYFANEKFEVSEYAKAVDDYQNMAWTVSLWNAIANVAQSMIIQTGMLIGAIECARRIVSYHTYTVGDFVLYLQYVNQLYGPLGSLQRQYKTLQRAMIDVETMLELFEEPPEVTDKPGATELVCKGEVEFDHVSFSYAPGKQAPVIKDLSAHVEPGETVALVGTSGGGKSTTLRLLYRFMDVTNGSIKVDGIDVRDVTQQSLRKAIGVVPQDTVLFNNTVRYNIRYGRLDATDAEIEEAAKAAQIHDRIMSFEGKYDTMVGERGLRLSGGEKQRIAIARTILRQPKILFLDEATSALDTRTEQAIQAQLNQLATGKTTLVIAHRLSTVINADLIMVLDQGNIVERGTFDELLAMQGVFAEMWQAQLRDPAEAEAKRGRKELGNRRQTSPGSGGPVFDREQSESPFPR